MKRRTRNYARRQLTWMRKLAGVTVLDRTGRTADDVADAVVWAVTRPSHVNVDLMVLRPRAQAAQHKVHRET